MAQGVNVADYTRIKKYAIPLKHWTFPDGGSLEFLSPGKQNQDYLATLSALDWDNFYEMLNGGEFLDALRDEMKTNYDYTLIDSRTGLSDVADVCTVHLPDVLVDCFTLSTQGIEGSGLVARRHRGTARVPRHPRAAGADAGRPIRAEPGQRQPDLRPAALREPPV